MTYINSAVLAVKDSDKETYREMAAGMAALFKKHGALHVFENWGSDETGSTANGFAKAVSLQAGERWCVPLSSGRAKRRVKQA